MTKRLVDVVFSAVGLVVLSPILIAIAVWVKLDSPGPVWFRQERVGIGGKPFRIHKFRSMVLVTGGPLLTVAGDSRITRSGAFLRCLKLDELPQLIDVLVGNMSLVGPRPEVPKYVAYYPPEVRDIVLSVRPGITDLAAIEFRDESDILARSTDPERAYVETILPVKLRHYVAYVEKRTMWLDVVIIARTLLAIFRRGSKAASRTRATAV
jgi:lipopolysaccharide/colanic/teichoic acid biosynthesis glycosyltransferase